MICSCQQLAPLAFVLGYFAAFASPSPQVALAEVANASPGQAVAKWVALMENEDPGARRRAAYALGQLGPAAAPAVAALSNALSDRHLEVRWYALDALGRIGPKAEEALSAIVAALQDSQNDKNVRVAAARSLGRIGPPARTALPALRDAQNGDEAEARVAAAVAIWRIDGADAAINVLGTELGSNNRVGSFAAAMALLELGADASPAAPALTEALGHREPDVRRAAARTLGQWGMSALPGLRDAIGAAEPAKRAAAARACGWIADDIRTRVLYGPETSNHLFKQTAVEVYDKIVPLVIVAARDPQREVQDAGLEALACVGPPAVPILLKWLTAADQTSRARAQRGLVALERYLPEAEVPDGMAQINKRVLPR
ncbi:MAG: HEAT repeat domain-containing protein [Pirellulales bacterium]